VHRPPLRRTVDNHHRACTPTAHTDWVSVAHKRSRVQALTRRWIAAVCVMAAAGATIVLWRIDEQTQPCRPVRALIDYNRATQDSLKAKTYFPLAGSYDEPKVPTDADYRAWAPVCGSALTE
jgi:hypothetical protein